MKMGRSAYVAEFIGTFALVFFGSSSVSIFGGITSPEALIGIAFASGLILMVMFYAIGHISGCHVNPAITITAMALKKIEVDDGIAYLIAQVLGATLAGWLEAFLIPGLGVAVLFGTPAPTAVIGQSAFAAVVVELIITFFLMFSFYAVSYTGKVAAGASGVLVGMTLTVGILFAGPLTGGAANPARALGPAVVAGSYQTLWIYFVGPIIGALIAGFVYQYLLLQEGRPRTRKQ
jgi:MIP family channel proteins